MSSGFAGLKNVQDIFLKNVQDSFPILRLL